MAAGETVFVLELSILIVAAILGGLIVKRFGYPAAMGEMIIGIVIGPFALGLVRYSEFLTLFSELGAIILLFYIGLETDLASLRRTVVPAIAVGVAGAIVPLGLGYWAALSYGMNEVEALFLGAVLMATSIGISVRLLRDIGKLHSTEGVVILGAGVVDDIVAVIFLSVVLGIAAGSFEVTNVASVALRAVVFWLVLVIVGIRFFPRFFNRLHLGREGLSLALLAMAFLFAFVSNEIGLSAIVGAFAVGVALSKLSKIHEVLTFLNSLFLFFVPIFFVSIGMLIDLAAFSTSLVPGLVLTALAIVGKVAGCSAASLVTGLRGKRALRIGIGMMPRGEMGLIIATTGLASGFIGREAYFSSIIVVLLTTIIALPLMKKSFGD